jgi:hypothetical protein
LAFGEAASAEGEVTGLDGSWERESGHVPSQVSIVACSCDEAKVTDVVAEVDHPSLVAAAVDSHLGERSHQRMAWTEAAKRFERSKDWKMIEGTRHAEV